MQKILDNIDAGIKNGLENNKNAMDITCPFCGSEGHDLIGLKNHLLYGGMFSDKCIAFEETPISYEKCNG